MILVLVGLGCERKKLIPDLNPPGGNKASFRIQYCVLFAPRLTTRLAILWRPSYALITMCAFLFLIRKRFRSAAIGFGVRNGSRCKTRASSLEERADHVSPRSASLIITSAIISTQNGEWGAAAALHFYRRRSPEVKK